MPCRPLDTEIPKRLTQPRQGASVERARQIVRCIGQERVLSEAAKQIKILSRRAGLIRSGRGLPERRMSEPERACVAVQQGQALQQLGTWTVRKQGGQQRILLRAGAIDLIDDASGRALRPEVRHLLHFLPATWPRLLHQDVTAAKRYH